MKRSWRQLWSLVAIAIAVFATAATSQAPAGSSTSASDRLTFDGEQRTAIRHVHIAVVPNPYLTQVTIDIPIEIGAINGKVPVTVTVIRDADQQSILQTWHCGNQPGCTEIPGSVSNDLGWFQPVAPCAANKACAADFTLTFERIPDDVRPDLAFDWTIRAGATISTSTPPGSAPPGGYVTVTITAG